MSVAHTPMRRPVCCTCILNYAIHSGATIKGLCTPQGNPRALTASVAMSQSMVMDLSKSVTTKGVQCFGHGRIWVSTEV
jgi:hypothetical protein